jgi:hypothetical protein
MHLIVHREMPEDRRRGMLTKVLGQRGRGWIRVLASAVDGEMQKQRVIFTLSSQSLVRSVKAAVILTSLSFLATEVCRVSEVLVPTSSRLLAFVG